MKTLEMSTGKSEICKSGIMIAISIVFDSETQDAQTQHNAQQQDFLKGEDDREEEEKEEDEREYYEEEENTCLQDFT